MLQRFKQKHPSLRDKEKTYIMKSPQFVFTGMRKDESPLKIDEQTLSNARNVLIKEGRWRKRHGLIPFGNGLPLPDPVMRIEQFFKYDGTEYLVAFTTKNIYVYNVTTEYWDLIIEKLLIDDCETAWAVVGGAESVADDTWFRYGVYSTKISSSTSFDSFNAPMFRDIYESDLERQIISAGLDTDILGISAGDLRELNILPDVTLLDSLNVPPISTDMGYDITQRDANIIVAGDLRELNILPDVTLLDSLSIPPILECDFIQSGHDTVNLSAEDLQELNILPNVGIGSGFPPGLIAYNAISSNNLSGYSHVHFYIKSNIDLDAGDLQLLYQLD